MFGFIYLFASDDIPWLNYPGLELWKFLNLAIFVGVAIFILRRRLATALEARRETIRQELLKAKQEHDEAEARLAEAEALLARLDSDVAALREQARREAELERERIKIATEAELQKLRLQAQREVETAQKVARLRLRRFLAERSTQVAKDSVVREIRPEDDARLIGASIAALQRSRI